MSSSLSGIRKLKYDKEHELAMYENTRADLKLLLAEGGKDYAESMENRTGKTGKRNAYPVSTTG